MVGLWCFLCYREGCFGAKSNFPRRQITSVHSNSPLEWRMVLYHSQISLCCKVVIKYMMYREDFFALFGQGCRAWVCSLSCHLECQLVLFFVLFDAHRALLWSTCGNMHYLQFHWCSLSLLFLPCLVFTSFLNVPQPRAWKRSSLCSLHFMSALSPAAFCCSSSLF